MIAGSSQSAVAALRCHEIGDVGFDAAARRYQRAGVEEISRFRASLGPFRR